ncbi:succinyl-diaminopimelate desuccinylase [Aquibaculum arenosum]|uniref:Succinyl-diaminopimelate desuccinylase n=1 Tax=Aquibaculum arenosum TaxID=3032591 RepID=A0ABT5YMA3_9PROT|nr:succinyl-diaminopimelate desuccinylase [Fodinicurvata sp. CAU 1616]MDF2096053.1 succinyl-diaminopimelate desuccinylase [Fodinicurvata sp. CAU 1616]
MTLRLIRCPSVTPAEGGALDLLQQELEALGFVCTRLPFEEAGTAPVDNLWAKLGEGAPHFCFAGHTDVVPPGEAEAWEVDPFAGTLREGQVIGRGAADMKGAIAAFVTAVAAHLARVGEVPGSISLLITGDEEGPSINGTRKVLEWLAERGERIDACLVGEPTNPLELGDMVKIGRRGSLTGRLTVQGKQGHIAYPHLADNPCHRIVPLLQALIAEPLDAGSEHFQPSSLQIASIDVGNPATNVIPAQARAVFNVRFNDHWTGASLEAWIRERLAQVDQGWELDVRVSGECFLTPPGPLAEAVAQAVENETGRKPELSTSGGTSDARFIRAYSPVVEFGLVGQTMHQVNERVAAGDIVALSRIYERVLERVFDAG